MPCLGEEFQKLHCVDDSLSVSLYLFIPTHLLNTIEGEGEREREIQRDRQGGRERDSEYQHTKWSLQSCPL
jgi:hypothetical protein